MRNRGQTLIGVLIAGAITTIVLISFITMLKSQTKATRSIAGMNGAMDLSHALDTLFSSAQCAATGIYLNGTRAAAVNMSGATYALSLDTINFANGTVAITSKPNNTIASMIQPNTIRAITLTPLGGNSTGTNPQFPFQMQVTFENPSGPPPQPINKFVTLYTAGAASPYTVVGGCYVGTGLPMGFNTLVFATPGTTSWTVPSGVNGVIVEVWGAGGGGCGQAGGAGGGGGYAYCLPRVASGQTYAITVGAGGRAAGAFPACTANSDGGASTFSGNGFTCGATGGTQGNGAGRSFPGPNPGGAGIGGRGQNGVINLDGGDGDDTAPAPQNWGRGGSAPRGGVGGAQPNTLIQMNGRWPGGGGGVGWNAPFSGAGANGGVILRW